MKSKRGLIAWSVAGIALIIWTAFEETQWLNFRHSLQAVPAFFLGLLLLIIGQLVVRLLVGAFKNGVRWWFSRPAIRLAGWTALFAMSTVVLFYNVELWRGKRAWAKVVRLASERGESLDLKTVLPGDVPADQNFAEAPLFAPMMAALATNETGFSEHHSAPVHPGNLAFVAQWEKQPAARVKELKYAPWLEQERTAFRPWLRFWQAWTNTAPFTRVVTGASRYRIPTSEIEVPEMQPAEAAELVLNSLKLFEPDLDQLRQFGDRPFCRFPLDYSRQMLREDHGLSLLNGYIRILRLRASALLALHRDEEALRDVQLALRLVDYARQQPWPMTSERRLGVFVDAVQPIWEGLTAHRWNISQLESLQHQLEDLDLLKDYAADVRNDAFAMADFIEAAIPTSNGSRVPSIREEGPDAQRGLALVRFFYPTGWSLQDQAAIHQMHLQVTSAYLDPTHRCISDQGSVMSVLFASSDPFFPVFVVPKVREMYAVASEIYPFAQTVADLASVACALERYRVENGHYPSSVDALVPRFITKLPHDVITGEPLNYRRTADDRFVLYSIGLNNTDDGGKPCEREKHRYERYDLDHNDWVWTWPANGHEAQAK